MSHERLALSSADLEDLDVPALDAFLVARAPGLLAATSRDEAATRLGLLGRSAPRTVPTLVGLYVFGRVPQYLFPEWGVGCAAIEGRSLTDPIRKREDLEGPVVKLLDQALAFVRAESGGGDEYPEGAVREALANALIHRDLRKASRVAVRVFSDRLEIWSPGGPPEGYTDLDDLAREGGISAPRNPLLASVARQLGVGEQIGRGLVVTRASLPANRRGEVDAKVELRSTPRDVLVVIPSSWQRPRDAQELS